MSDVKIPKHGNALMRLLASDDFDGDVYIDEPASSHTTYQCGGNFKYFVVADSVAALQQVLRAAVESNTPYFMIGKGSNTLVSDDGFVGVAISLGRDFRNLSVNAETGEIVAGAGVSFARLSQNAFQNSLSGLEFAVGIPGTIGGALRMNAGTGGVGLGDVVSSVSFLDKNNDFQLTRRAGDEISWGYHESELDDLGVAVECELNLKKDAGAALKVAMEEKLAKRNATQPVGHNCGSVFKNPEGDSAGRLIEACGLKGKRVGGAEISTLHANFFPNVDDASAADVKALIDLARASVKDKFGVELVPEVVLLGFED